MKLDRNQLRPATIEDLPQITEIYNDAVTHSNATLDTEPRTKQAAAIWWQKLSGTYPIWVIEDNGAIHGYAALVPWSDKKGYLPTAEFSIYLRPDAQGHGLGNTLSKKIIEDAKKGPFQLIISRITEGNQASIRLHEKLGFRALGVLPKAGEKFGKRLDVHVYLFPLV